MNTMSNVEPNFIETVYSFNFYIQMENSKSTIIGDNNFLISKHTDTSLGDFIKGRQKPDRNQNYDIMSQLVNGIASIHRNGIVHRDLKSSNIFYKDGVWKIANFGFSETDKISSSRGSKKLIDPEVMTMTDQERTKLSLQSQKQIDIHALGVILSDLIRTPTTIMEEEKIDTTN